VTKRITANAPTRLGDLIELWAQHEGQSVSSLAVDLLQKAIDQAKKDGQIPKTVLEQWEGK
jgi:hypothetical protein